MDSMASKALPQSVSVPTCRQSDIAWAITTIVEADPPGAAVKPGKAARAAHTQLIAASSAMQTAGSSELLLMPSTICSGGISAPLAM